MNNENNNDEFKINVDDNSETSTIIDRLNKEAEDEYTSTLNKELEKTTDKSEKFKKFDYFNSENKKNDENTIEEDLEKTYKVATSKPVVQLRELNLNFGRDRVLDNVTMTVNEGEFLYLVGESGAGKSSIIKLLYKEITNQSGKLLIHGEDITNLSRRKLPYLRRKIGVIFQDFRLLPDKTVYENVRFSLDVTNYPRSKRKDRVYEVLKQVGVFEKKNKYPDELSGGQQQRVAIARAIVDGPSIIVADEPTGNLDPENALSIMEILLKINSQGTTVVMATHDVGIVNSFKQRVLLMKDGKIINEVKGEYIYE